MSAADVPGRRDCTHRTQTCHKDDDSGMCDLQEACWLDLKGQSLTRKTLHWESERADQPCGAARSVSTAFVYSSE